MTKEQVIVEALASAPGQAAGMKDLTLRVNRIMVREGERELTTHTIQDLLQEMRVQAKPLVDVSNIEKGIWKLTRDGKKAAKK